MSESTPMVPGIHRSAVFAFDTTEELVATTADPRRGYSYGRYNNPTVEVFEREVARLERAERALAFGSGMAAITTAILALVPAGGRVVHQRELYGGTVEFFRDFLPRFGISAVDVSATAPSTELEDEVGRGADLVYLETPVNPTLRIVDLEFAVRAARSAGAITIVDNTFATPLGQRPLDFGADVSVHSATKFLGGHHDVVAGVLATSGALADRIWKARKILGGILSPSDAFLLYRGLKTLALRVEAGSRTAAALASFLEGEPTVRRVFYPGSPTHPDHALASRQMNGGGALVSFELDTDAHGASRFLDALSIIRRAASLGGVESTAMIPARVSHAGLTPEERARMGVSDSLIRISVGAEREADLREDLVRGLRALRD